MGNTFLSLMFETGYGRFYWAAHNSCILMVNNDLACASAAREINKLNATGNRS